MSIIDQKCTGVYPDRANGRGRRGDAAETLEQTLETSETTGQTLTLEWFRLLNPAAGAGREGQRLHARWRLK